MRAPQSQAMHTDACTWRRGRIDTTGGPASTVSYSQTGTP